MKLKYFALLWQLLFFCCAKSDPNSLPNAQHIKAVLQPETTQTLPNSKAGADVTGKPFPIESLVWLSEKPSSPPKVWLFRWWTDTCPYCEATLPSIDALRRDFSSRGLVTVAIYHPKPPRPIAPDFIVTSAKESGYLGLLAIDIDWSLLEKVWLSTGERKATSVTFIVDQKGIIRFVHPGPEFHSSEKLFHGDCQKDFNDIKETIQFLLSEP